MSKSHGQSRTPTYNCWARMIGRCTNPNNLDYTDYGARGISVCDRWRSFENFFLDMGKRPSEKHSIDRIDNDRGYEPNNCRWALPVTQANNRRSSRMVVWDGEIRTLADVVRENGAPYWRVMNRLRSGWSLERAIKTPPDTSKINNGLRPCSP